MIILPEVSGDYSDKPEDKAASMWDRKGLGIHGRSTDYKEHPALLCNEGK